MSSRESSPASIPAPAPVHQRCPPRRIEPETSRVPGKSGWPTRERRQSRHRSKGCPPGDSAGWPASQANIKSDNKANQYRDRDIQVGQLESAEAIEHEGVPRDLTDLRACDDQEVVTEERKSPPKVAGPQMQQAFNHDRAGSGIENRPLAILLRELFDVIKNELPALHQAVDLGESQVIPKLFLQQQTFPAFRFLPRALAETGLDRLCFEAPRLDEKTANDR